MDNVPVKLEDEAVARATDILGKEYFKPTKIGIKFAKSIPFKEWEKAGKILKTVNGAMLWWWGDWLNYGEQTYEKDYSRALDESDYEYGTLRNAKYVTEKIELSRRRDSLTFSHHQEVATLEPDEQDRLLDEAEKEGWTVKELRRKKQLTKITDFPPPKGKYRTIVIDPPWPIQKIIRTERPNQDLIDYPTMDIEQIAELSIPAVKDGCHIYLWVTHKFLPTGFKLFEKWGVKYECLLTWVKNVGMTPFSFIYSTEHVLFGRIGSLELLKKGKRLDFSAKVEKHSTKPDIFYDLVSEVSPEPRLDMFARKKRKGFKSYGNEV